MPGSACCHSCRSVASGWRVVAINAPKFHCRQPFREVGADRTDVDAGHNDARRNLTTARSASVYSARFTLPSPVAARRNESDSHGGIADKLSKATTQDPATLTRRSPTSRRRVAPAEGERGKGR
jgi:hypothetical protein